MLPYVCVVGTTVHTVYWESRLLAARITPNNSSTTTPMIPTMVLQGGRYKKGRLLFSHESMGRHGKAFHVSNALK
jgi:hypothetical protein